MGKNRSPNDDRSDSKNTNNPAYRAVVDNRADQLNPNDPSTIAMMNRNNRPLLSDMFPLAKNINFIFSQISICLPYI